MLKKSIWSIALLGFLAASLPGARQASPGAASDRISFQAGGQRLNEAIGRGVVLGDFNGDKALDAFVVNEEGSGTRVRVYFGDGRGRFSDGPSYEQAMLAVQPVTLDVDGDGRLDVVTGRVVWLNDGSGRFSADAARFVDGDGAPLYCCRVGDLDKDGRTDIFAITFIAKGMDPRGFPDVETRGRVYRNDGRGRFRDDGQSLGRGVMSTADLADVDGDGSLDAIVSGWRNVASDPCPNRVFLNDGRGRFRDSGQEFDEDLRHSHGLAAGDLDKDGDQDFVLATQAAPFARLYLNDGRGRFSAGRTLGMASAEKVALLDLDGDGGLDVLLACQGPNEVWLGDGRGGFGDSGLRLGSEWTWQLASGDLNGDGRPDLFLVDLGLDPQAPPGKRVQGRPAEVWLNASRKPADARAAVPAPPAGGAGPRLVPTAPGPRAAVSVAQGDGAPVITDGLFSPGEWSDARTIALNEWADLCLKEYRGVVYSGIRGREGKVIGPSELYLSVPGGPILKLHVSAQLYEAAVAAAGAEPEPRFGRTEDWYANEMRRDEPLAARLQKEGKSPQEIIQAASYPSHGLEFAIRRAKLPGSVWRIRLWVTGFFGGKPGLMIWPPNAAERDTAGWLELKLKKAPSRP